jgi:hypothetical protein
MTKKSKPVNTKDNEPKLDNTAKNPTEGVESEKTVPVQIRKPKKFLDKFKSKRDPSISGVATLVTALPVLRIADAGDFVHLHPNDDPEDGYWSVELCFVLVPIHGDSKQTQLHLIDEEIAVHYLPSKKIKRFRLALATKPNDVMFLCQVPSTNLDNGYNRTALKACKEAQSLWVQVTSRKAEGVEEYKIDYAVDHDAFNPPNWTLRSFDELLEITFRGVSIEDDNHPGLLRLRGAKQILS